MLSTRSLQHSSPRGSAALARHRLLTDRTMRQAAQATPLLRPSRLVRTSLSPADQRALVQAIAHSYHNHYLAQTTYLDDCNLTVATLLPRAAHSPDPVGPQRISVDAAGNASVSSWDSPAEVSCLVPIPRRLARLVLAAIIMIGIIAGCWLNLAF